LGSLQLHRRKLALHFNNLVVVGVGITTAVIAGAICVWS
jgi:hypothetical protein